MDDEQKLREQIARLKARYLARTIGELRRIGELLRQVEEGSALPLKELERMTHKIHGSSSMFGFKELANAAGAVERIAGHLGGGEAPEELRGLGEAELRRRLAASVAQLERLTRATALDFGIDSNAG